MGLRDYLRRRKTESIEGDWPHDLTLRREIETVRIEMLTYADLLAKVAGIRAIVAPATLAARQGAPQKPSGAP